MPVSFAKKDQVHGGLVINDVDGILIEPRFVNPFTYPNSSTNTCALVGKLRLTGGDEELIFWSVGPCEAWEVIDGGKGLESTKGNSGTIDSTNFSKFIDEYERLGGPAIGTDISVLDGLEAHWVQVPTPYQGTNRDASKGPKTMPAPSAIIRLPGEKKKKATGTAAAGATAAAASKPAAAASSSASDMENDAAVALATSAMDILKGKHAGAALTKSNWGVKILNGLSALGDDYVKADQGTKDIAQRILRNSDFLKSQDVTVSDKGDVTFPDA